MFRSSLLALTLGGASLIACSSNGGGTVTPTGAHTHYVGNAVYVPTTNVEATAYGLDLNGDGTVDNQLGNVLATLGGMGFDIQGTVNTAVAEGDIILLVDFQATNLTSTAAAGLQMLLGSNPVPPACNGSADVYTCDMSTPPVC